MKNKFLPITACIVVLFGLVAFRFCGREFLTWKPESVTQKDSLHVVDEYDSYVEYDLVLTTTVYPKNSIWITERSALKDSISNFNVKLLISRFKGEYPKHWNEGVAQEILFPRQKFVYEEKVDSASYFLEIRRTIKPKIWFEKIPTSSNE